MENNILGEEEDEEEPKNNFNSHTDLDYNSSADLAVIVAKRLLEINAGCFLQLLHFQ